jgi:hypothetical protein
MALTETEARHLSWLPALLHQDPDVLGAVRAMAAETDKLDVAIETMRTNFFPRFADLFLYLWEKQFGLSVAPIDMTLEQRQARAQAFWLQIQHGASGELWEQMVTDLVGSGWSYTEFDGDGSPPDYNIAFETPFATDSTQARDMRSLLRAITPAHLDIVEGFTGGFILGYSNLGETL